MISKPQITLTMVKLVVENSHNYVNGYKCDLENSHNWVHVQNYVHIRFEQNTFNNSLSKYVNG